MADINISVASQDNIDISLSEGIVDFIGLADTPSSYTGQGSKGVRVNSGATALEFYDISSVGEANTASNLGAGEGIFSSKSSVDLQFKSLVAGTGTALSSDANTITIGSDMTLQEVTDQGATTTNNITIDKGGLVDSVLNINGSTDSAIRSTATDLFQLRHNALTMFQADASGNVYLPQETTNGIVRTSGGNGQVIIDTNVSKVISGQMATPVADKLLLIQVPNAGSVTRITGACDSGTTVTFNVEERAPTTPNTSGTDMMASDLVADSDTQVQTSFSNADFDQYDWLAVTVTSVTGTPTYLAFTIIYELD